MREPENEGSAQQGVTTLRRCVQTDAQRPLKAPSITEKVRCPGARAGGERERGNFSRLAPPILEDGMIQRIPRLRGSVAIRPRGNVQSEPVGGRALGHVVGWRLEWSSDASTDADKCTQGALGRQRAGE